MHQLNKCICVENASSGDYDRYNMRDNLRCFRTPVNGPKSRYHVLYSLMPFP